MTAPSDRERFEAAISEITPSGKVLFDKHPKRFKLDPDLTDGQHHCIHDLADAELLRLIRDWAREAEEGESITIEIVRMSQEAADGLADL